MWVYSNGRTNSCLLRPTDKKIAWEVLGLVFIHLLENTVKQVELQMIYFGRSFHICLGDLGFKLLRFNRDGGPTSLHNFGNLSHNMWGKHLKHIEVKRPSFPTISWESHVQTKRSSFLPFFISPVLWMIDIATEFSLAGFPHCVEISVISYLVSHQQKLIQFELSLEICWVLLGARA